MRLARWTFALAGIYGLIATLSLYIGMELTTDTLWRFVFAGAAAATQLAYLLIARDPLRYRWVIPVGIASKLSYATPVSLLFARGGVAASTFGFALIDLTLAALFAISFVRLGAVRP